MYPAGVTLLISLIVQYEQTFSYCIAAETVVCVNSLRFVFIGDDKRRALQVYAQYFHELLSIIITIDCNTERPPRPNSGVSRVINGGTRLKNKYR